MLSSTIPAMAAENRDVETVSNIIQTSSIHVDDSGITINGVYYTPKEFEKLLDTAVPTDIVVQLSRQKSKLFIMN